MKFTIMILKYYYEQIKNYSPINHKIKKNNLNTLIEIENIFKNIF